MEDSPITAEKTIQPQILKDRSPIERMSLNSCEIESSRVFEVRQILSDHPQCEAIVMLGIGDGQKIVEIAKQTEKRIILYEPTLELLTNVMALKAYQEIQSKIEICTKLIPDAMPKNFIVLEEESSIRLAPDVFEVVRLRLSFSAIKSVIAIQNYGTSGTLFMHSLLDNHPNLLALPGLNNRSFYSFWAKNEDTITDLLDLIKAFISENPGLFFPDMASKTYGLHQLGPEMNETVSVDPEEFTKAIIYILQGESELQRHDFFKAIYVAYAFCLKRTISYPLHIVFPIHSNLLAAAQCLHIDIPETKFLYMIREPVQNIGSAIKHIISNNLPVCPLECSISSVLADLAKHWGIESERLTYGDRPYLRDVPTRAIKLEDLHETPEKVMQAICRFLGIPWSDCLLESTFDGKKWWNRPESTRVSGFGGGITQQKHKQYLTGFDKIRLLCFAFPKLKTWDYPRPWYIRFIPFRILIAFLSLLPFKMEVTYFIERYRKAMRGYGQEAVQLLNFTVKCLNIPRVITLKLYEKTIQKKMVTFLNVLSAFVYVPVFLIRDYVMIRWYLVKSLFYDYNTKHDKVALMVYDHE